MVIGVLPVVVIGGGVDIKYALAQVGGADLSSGRKSTYVSLCPLHLSLSEGCVAHLQASTSRLEMLIIILLW